MTHHSPTLTAYRTLHLALVAGCMCRGASFVSAQSGIDPPARAGLSWSDMVAGAPQSGRTSEPMRNEGRDEGPEEYLRHGTDWFTVGAGLSAGTRDITEENVHFAYSYFVANRVEVIGEAALRAFQQPGKDVFGINPAIVFRWHFYVSEDKAWTAYADLGLGVMLTTDDVPENATSLNLTPRAGVGLTRQLTEGTRLQLGLRWSHVSNGRMFGEDDNPGHDGAMLYAGLIFDF